MPPIVVTGKYRGSPSGRAVLTGTGTHGPITQTVSLSDASATRGQALAQTWARARAARLGDLGRAGDQTHKAELTALGLRYHLLTEHTSFVAVDSQVHSAPGNPSSVQQPSPMPATTAESGGVSLPRIRSRPLRAKQPAARRWNWQMKRNARTRCSSYACPAVRLR